MRDNKVLQTQQGVGTKFMSVLLENVKPDYVTANRIMEPTSMKQSENTITTDNTAAKATYSLSKGDLLFSALIFTPPILFETIHNTASSVVAKDTTSTYSTETQTNWYKVLQTQQGVGTKFMSVLLE